MSSRCGLSCLSGPAGWRLCGPKSQESHGAYKKQHWWESSSQPRPLLSGWEGALKIRRGLAAGGLGKSSTTRASIRPLSQSEGLGSAQSWPPGPSSELPEASRVSLGLPHPHPLHIHHLCNSTPHCALCEPPDSDLRFPEDVGFLYLLIGQNLSLEGTPGSPLLQASHPKHEETRTSAAVQGLRI